jgi:hypothetical protein
MIELRDWIGTARFEHKPWLILGKGPSFSRRNEVRVGEYNVLGLNNVVRELPLDVAHIVDIDVVEDVAETLSSNCRYLLMPRRPHIHAYPGVRLLEEYFADYPVLRELASAGRLVWYNAATSRPVGDSPVIGLRYFSSEAAFNILAEMGVTSVRSLGIDGGDTYGREFAALQELTNGRPSFDAQFSEMEAIVQRHNMDYDALTEPMRIYVGLDESQIVAAQVLEYSIRKHASRPVRVIPMLNVPTPVPKDLANRGRTGFSFSRFHIPKLAGYRGKAVYLDADMQVFADIAELFDLDFGENRLLVTRQDEPPKQWKDSDWFKAGRQMSVMVLDCAKLDWDVDKIVADLDAGHYTYGELMFDMAIVPDEEIGDYVPAEWNHLEHYVPGETKLLHYTIVPTQPWKNDENPLRALWMNDYEEARSAGVVKTEDVQRLLRKRLVKPTLAPLPMSGRLQMPVYWLLAKLQTLLRLAEQRLPVLRHPRILAIRRRVGQRALGG